MKPTTTIRTALSDPALLGNVLSGTSWSAWRTLLIASMGEELRIGELAQFTQLTSRPVAPTQRVEELVAIVGRRGGKSRALSVLAAYIAGLCDHRDNLAPGETGVLLIISPNQRQAKIALDYACAAFERSPILRQLIANRNSDTLELTNGVNIEVRAASFRRLRGPTYIGVLADEAAFWYSDEFSANPDVEILAACRPGLATTRGPMIIASSPYAKRGELWTAHKKHYSPEGDPMILVAQGASRDFNPSLPQSVVDRALERDRSSATAEYLAQFRNDIESFVQFEIVEACVGEYRELSPLAVHRYSGFVDPSGGSADSFTLAISHRDGERIMIDAIREVRPPFSPESTINDLAVLLKTYSITRVTGDRYAGEFPRELFRKRGISYECAELPKSDLFRDLLPKLNAGSIVLPRSDRLINQLCNLERRVSRAGKDSIDHSPGGHDDLANAVAGAASIASKRPSASGSYFIADGVSPGPSKEDLSDHYMTRNKSNVVVLRNRKASA